MASWKQVSDHIGYLDTALCPVQISEYLTQRVGLFLCRQLVAVEDLKWVDILMVSLWVVFAGVVGAIENTFLPKIFELALGVAAFNQLNHWSFDLDAFGVIPIRGGTGKKNY